SHDPGLRRPLFENSDARSRTSKPPCDGPAYHAAPNGAKSTSSAGTSVRVCRIRSAMVRGRERATLECLLLAQSGHSDRAQRCPLGGLKRTSCKPVRPFERSAGPSKDEWSVSRGRAAVPEAYHGPYTPIMGPSDRRLLFRPSTGE